MNQHDNSEHKHDIHTQHKQKHQLSHNHHSEHAKMYKKVFLNSLILGLPILFLAPMMGVKLPFQFTFPYSEYVVAFLASILFIYGGKPFLSGAKSELSARKPAMMMLVSMGITVAYAYSMYGFIIKHILHKNIDIMDFFFELSSLILIMLLGHWLEMKSVSKAHSALESIAALLPNTVIRIKDDKSHETVSLNDIEVNDILLVKAGENVPSDGIIVSGTTYINESMLTGESQAVFKEVGGSVIGGSQNTNGNIQIKVTKTGEDSYLSQLMRLVESASSEKSKSENMADLVAKYLFYFALIIGVLSLFFWTIIENVDHGIMQMVAVLVIACPHALGLAVPLVTARSTAIGAQNGLLIKSRIALEKTPKIDMIFMDKTGTLTEGNFEVHDYLSYSDKYSNLKMLQLFASLENHSNHPLAQGVLRKAKEYNLELFELSEVKTMAGIGLKGIYNNQNVEITNVRYLDQNDIMYDKKIYDYLSEKAYSISYLLVDETVIGHVVLGDDVKQDAKKLINSLKQHNITPVMLTGDNRKVAESIAKILGIDSVYSEMLPEDKEKIISKYKEEGHSVMMVGDGINDAPSLARADVAVSIGAGTDIANETADIILVKSRPSDILHILSLAKSTQRKMKQNLFWGAGYNFIAIPIAAGILSGFGIILTPAMGATLMSVSTIVVAVNAMSLRLK